MFHLFVLFLLFNRTFVFDSSTLNCPIPDGCQIKTIYTGLKERKVGSILCDIDNDEFEFKLPLGPNITFENCQIKPSNIVNKWVILFLC